MLPVIMTLSSCSSSRLSMRTLLGDTAHQITLLEQGVIPDTLKELRDDCDELIRTFEAALIEHQLATGVIRNAVYAQCALVDEVVARNLPQEMRELWGHAPLQMACFCHGDDSGAVLERMVTQLQSATPELALLECYSTILELGFQGCHAAAGKVEHRDLLTALYTKIAALRRMSAHDQNPDATEQPRPFWFAARPRWLMTTLTAALVVLLYLLLNHALDQDLYSSLQLPSSMRYK